MESSSIEHNGGGGQRFQREPASAIARRLHHLAEQADQNRGTLRQSERARFWFAVKTAMTCILGGLIGLLPMAWALHTTDLESARLAWALGPVIGNTIVLATLIVAWIKWDRDDW